MPSLSTPPNVAFIVNGLAVWIRTNVPRQRFVILYLDGPARSELDSHHRRKIRKWLRKVWEKLVKRCVEKGIPGPISGVIA